MAVATAEIQKEFAVFRITGNNLIERQQLLDDMTAEGWNLAEIDGTDFYFERAKPR